ncbi:hypothetical protein WG902_07175 [Ramlibacter sp. PS3R-8]|uniref:hypothetical protein n=1 Tax=Ramlibacter sp. PS3R-8 TaxID=3133437 RepID=UPI0030A959AD
MPPNSMDETNQIEPPPSFVALFASPSGHKLLEPMSTVRQRYELCEDLAQALTEQASVHLFKSGGSEREVLEKMELALTTQESPITAREAKWVVTRLAELSGWDPA